MSSNPSPVTSKVKFGAIGKQKNLDEAVDAKRRAFKASRNVTIAADVHHQTLYNDDPYLIHDLTSYMEQHPTKVIEHKASTEDFDDITISLSQFNLES